MKKFTLIMASICLIITSSVFATNQKSTPPEVMIYSQPSESSKVIEKINPNVRLVEIFQKSKDWIKVGNPNNGNVGWINQQQYQQAWNEFNQPNIKTIFVQYSKNDKNGKPEMNVIAYQNGKKVSDKEAKELYEKIKKQNSAEQKQMQQFFSQVNQNMGPFFSNAGFGSNHLPNFPNMRPMIIIDN